ncbi:MAG: hypothetical protein ACRC2R_24765 [Xenococcaceae cyanobacterium]
MAEVRVVRNEENKKNPSQQGFEYLGETTRLGIFDNPSDFNLFTVNDTVNHLIALKYEEISHFFAMNRELNFGDRILGRECNNNDNCAEIVATLIGVDASLISAVDLMSNGY